MNHLRALPLNGEPVFDGGDRWIRGGEPEASPIGDSMAAFEKWESAVLSRHRPNLLDWAPVGSRLSSFQVGAEMVVIVGAPPGAGKTALAGQVVLNAMRADKDLRCLSVNVEMPPGALLDRHLARLTGVGYSYIQNRDYDEDAKPRLIAGMEILRELMPRIEFLRPPFTIENIGERAVGFDAGLVVLDYCQRIDHAKKSGDMRAQINSVMECCRRLADDGRAVLAISAVNRAGYGKDATIAAFRESSEMEYGCDSAWLLIRDGDSAAVTLRCVKNRHGRLNELQVLFDGSRQEFTDDPAEFSWMPE